MTKEQEEHLNSIVKDASIAIATKYRAGQDEHGGNLWTKKGIIDMAIDEAIDQVTYLLTLKRQLEEAGVELGSVSE